MTSILYYVTLKENFKGGLMEEEFTGRCQRAIQELIEIRDRYNLPSHQAEFMRLKGKVEGVKLALEYYQQEQAMKEE